MRNLVLSLLAALPLMMLGGCASQPSIVLTPDAVLAAPDDYLILAVNNQPQRYSRAGTTARSYGTANNYMESAVARRNLQAIANDYDLQAVSGWPIPALALHCVLFKRGSNSNMTRAQLLEQLQHDSRIAIAQPLQSFTTNTSENMDYNDPYAPMQTNLRQMNIREAHQWSRGRDVRIALIDTGIDAAHPDLQNRVVLQRNFVDSRSASTLLERHGTAMAGVIAANANNGIGIVGIAPQAKLYALKACWQLKPDRDDAACNSFTLAQALASAIDLRVQIINLSLVGPSDPLLTALIERAQHAGIIVVGAAGAGFPTQLRDVIGVAGFEDDAVATAAMLHAPSHDVMTLLPDARYDFSSGNSIATAEITGTIALLLAGETRASNAPFDAVRLQQLLRSSGGDTAVVNACLALTRVLARAQCGSEAVARSEGHSAEHRN